jgi:NAD-dependent SIR2 family protein deacetylase
MEVCIRPIQGFLRNRTNKLQDEASREAARRQHEVIDRLRNDLKNKRLVLITGAGVTLSATADSSRQVLSRITWTGLIRNGLDYLMREGYVDQSNRRIRRAYDALHEQDMDDLLDAASILRSQLGHNDLFPTWLESVFGSLYSLVRNTALLDAIKELHKHGVMLLTTNYDDLLERHCDIPRIGRSTRDNIFKFRRRDLDGVFHIHGSYHDPHEVILDTTDYYQVQRSDDVQDMLKAFFNDKIILFVGCGSGLEDPNFDKLLHWASKQHKNISNRHCLLVRDGDNTNYKPLVRLKYGPNYDDLAPRLLKLIHGEDSFQKMDQSV